MTQKDLPLAGPSQAPPTHFYNGEGLGLRLQVFLAVRDAQRRVAVVREKATPQYWRLPGETLQPGEDVNTAAQRVAKLWFGRDLPSRVAEVLTWPDTGDRRWYILFVFEAAAPDRIDAPPDTEEIRFVPAGKAPGPFALDHANVFERLTP